MEGSRARSHVLEIGRNRRERGQEAAFRRARFLVEAGKALVVAAIPVMADGVGVSVSVLTLAAASALA